MFESILPPSNTTDGERALEEAVAPPTEGIDTIETLQDPLRTPAASLPWLGWAFDVPFWPDNETDRRRVVARSFKSHQQMGTLASMRELARFANAPLMAAYLPPAKTFAGVNLTEAEREAFLARMPSIYVWPFRNEGKAVSMFVGDFIGGTRRCTARTDALVRSGDYLEYVDPDTGETTPLNTMELDRLTETRLAHRNLSVKLPGKAHGVFLGIPPARFIVKSDAADRLYTIALETPYQSPQDQWRMLSVRPSLDPVNGFYEQVRLPGVARGVFLGRPLGNSFLVRSDAGARIGKRLRLFDKTRVSAIARRRSSLYLGANRLGKQLPHHARLALDTRRPAPPFKAFATGGLVRRFPVKSTASERIEQIRKTMLWGHRESDRTALDLSPFGTVKVSTSVVTGQRVVGEYVSEVY